MNEPTVVPRTLQDAETAHAHVRQGPPIDAVLRLILAQMPAVVWAVDSDLRYTHSEGGGLVELGVSPGDVVGMDLFRYFGTDDASYAPIAAHVKALAGEPQSYELDWQDRTFLSRLEPLRALGGEIVGVVGVAHDITDRKRAEQGVQRALEALSKSDAARRDLLFKLVTAQEDEARRIAGDVHDGPVQHLTAIGLRLSLLRDRLEDARDRMAVEQLEEMATVAIRDMRGLLFQLVPPDLASDGLGAAVHGLLARLEQETGISPVLKCTIAVEPAITVATSTYRIVQEAVTNVRKHASARTVAVRLRAGEDGVSASVRDDGVGFDPSREVGPEHLGLRGIRERVTAAGGRIDIRSAVGEGSTIEFDLPHDLRGV